jgi:orotate phosphoribosyltransferase
MGGIVVAYELGRQLGVPAIFTEREDGKMVLRRGFEIHPAQRVLVTEDVVTTGKSSLETIEVLKQHGAEVVGIACIANRSTSDIGYPIFDAIKLDIESWEPENCPLCKEGIPCVKPGSRTIQ